MGNTGGWWRGGGNNATWLTKLWQGFMKYALKMSSYLPFCSSSMAKNLLKALRQSPEKKTPTTNENLWLSPWRRLPFLRSWNKTLSWACLFVCLFACLPVAGCLPYVPFVCIQILQTPPHLFVCRGNRQLTTAKGVVSWVGSSLRSSVPSPRICATLTVHIKIRI